MTTTSTTMKRKRTRTKRPTRTKTPTKRMMRRRATSSPSPIYAAGPSLDAKAQHLFELLRDYGSAIVAFSGGVDSAYLAWAATQCLGDRAVCITAESPSYPEHHRQLALAVAHAAQLHHEFVHTGEVDR